MFSLMFHHLILHRRITSRVPLLNEKISRALWAAAFVASYVALDWASFIRPLQQLNLTPWNPAPALGLLFLLRRGRSGIPMLLAAIVTSDALVRDAPGDLPFTLLLGMLLTAGYASMAWLLLRHQPEGGLFSDRLSLLRWSLIIILGSFANGLLFVTALLLGGLLSPQEWYDAMVRFWVGDGVGIFVTLPLLWWLQDRAHLRLFWAMVGRWETLAYLTLALLALWIAFVPGAQVHYRYFYVLFLPLVWSASRQGLAGAVFSVAFLQMGMMFAGMLQQSSEISLLELQIRAFLLASVGFLIGITVDEQRRAVAELRQSLRLAAAGEMAGALAHELNQPLTALSAYGAACEQLLERHADATLVRDVIRRMVNEATRAAEVVRRLRDFFRTGSTKLEVVSLNSLISTTANPFLEKANGLGIDFAVTGIPSGEVIADRLQLEVVLRNLLANAFDAVAPLKPSERQVRLHVFTSEAGRVIIEVTDSGPGLLYTLPEQAFEPFASTKSSGLGLGLAISRAIAEAHGGTLTADPGGRGCFRLTLPLEPRNLLRHA